MRWAQGEHRAPSDLGSGPGWGQVGPVRGKGCPPGAQLKVLMQL